MIAKLNKCLVSDSSLVIFLMSILLAMAMLYAYDGRRIQAEHFALGKENTSRTESWNGVPFTAHNISEITQLVKQQASRSAELQGGPRQFVAWFGNSQLHTLNQYKQGQHLSAFWMRKQAPCPDCLVPMALSLPNVNPQESFVLSRYVASQLPLNAVILEVEFMGFREDGLRSEFTKIASTSLMQELMPYAVGKDLAALASVRDSKGTTVAKSVNVGIDGEFQQAVESRLSDALATVWPLWRDRVNLRSTLLSDLFTFRNWVFHISSQSERKIIKPRFIRNMAALEDFLKNFKASQTPVILYFAPVLPDKPLPYDRLEYTHWKSDIQSLATRYSATCLDLDKLVPPQNWGSNFGEDIDFMHFQEAGHKLVAEALQPVVAKVMR